MRRAALGAFLLLVVLGLLPAPASYAADRCASWVAQLASVQGRVEMQRAGTIGWQPVSSHEVFCPGDSLRVGALGRAAVLLRPETMLRLDQGTTITFPVIAAEQPSWLDLLDGAVHFISRHPRGLQIKTPFVNAAIEGTEFVLRVEPEQTDLWVFEGRVMASNQAGSLAVESGEAAVTRAGQPPTRRIDVRPRDAVQWALYYPPLIDFRAAARETNPDARTMQEALERYRQGDLTGALAQLEDLPAASRDAPYFTLKAGLLLSVGRLDAAQSDISQALRLDADNGTALALQSVVALAQNENDKALDLAKKASEREPRSPVPLIALSYAQQANFKIDAALKTVEDALKLEPDDALVWARLAELRLSTGNLDLALQAAQGAVARNPDLARTQTVLGFAHLTRIEIVAARRAFEKAIALDQADPLPRLGLGLAKIRAGALEAGRQDIEVATSLDPNNSLIRSYMGKAYFEERQDALAGSQLAMAKELDPKDPTPWLYDAIHKQIDNRPVEALSDLEQSIELNDNRAVYRSRLLLDQDRAVRGVSVARTYEDLGFNELAVVEATRSLNLDPANSSAHRFLSDAYAGVSQFEVARVSELLQAQLLQPINGNPVQPQLGETYLNLPSAGPAKAAFGEFTPLFTGNRTQLTASGLAGNDNTLGDETVLSGILGKFSYSLGQFHYKTDGFRENDDVRHDIYNVFAQGSVTDKLDIQLEYRHRETDQGDPRLLFDSSFDPSERRGLNQDTFRLGMHLAESPRSDFVASVIQSDRKTSLDQTVPDAALFTEGTRQRGTDTQGEYLFRGDGFDLVAGGGYSRINTDTHSLFELFPDACLIFGPPCVIPDAPPTSSIKQHNFYAYTNARFHSNTTWTFGLSYDAFDDSTIAVNKFNPKLGLQWKILDGLRLRAVALKSLKRELIVEQTLEPTQVAGFNQFFDDFNGTRAKMYGAGLDATFKGHLFAGVEATRRALTVPNPDTPVNENLYRGYSYWALNSNWALSGEARFERVKLDPLVFGLEFDRLSTASVPLTIRYFNPQGIFANLGPTFVRQNVHFPDPGSDQLSNRFTVVDAAVGYRLPKRRGIVSLEGKNLLDKKFNFQDLDFLTSDSFRVSRPFLPQRTILLRVTLTL